MLNTHFKVSYTFLTSDTYERITTNVGESLPFDLPPPPPCFLFLVNNEYFTSLFQYYRVTRHAIPLNI